MITQARLKELLDYDPDTGEFTWKERRGSKAKGSKAGCKNHQNSCEVIRVDDVLYLSHRLVWLYVYGYLPTKQIDHINRNPGDNRLCNLREATQTENNQNTKVRKDSGTGVKGVHYDKGRNKFQVQLAVNGKRVHCKRYDTLAEA
jgi:ubiquitin